MGQKDQMDAPEDTGQKGSVLNRKVRAGQEIRQARAMSLPKALRLTLAKVAQSLLGLALAVIGVRSETRNGEDLKDLFDQNQLLMLLDGPNGRRGAIIFDFSLVGAMIQQQTMGRVTPQLEGDSRKMTATDAAICGPFIDALLKRVAPVPEEPADRALIEGYAFGAQVTDPRLLLMALEEQSYEVVHLTVDVAGGARQGMIMLCLPHISAEEAQPEANEDATPGQRDVKKSPLLGDVLMGVNVELNIALTRIRMPVSALQSLQVGDLLDLGVTGFEHASVLTLAGRKISKGTLGQINGMRAMQVEHEVQLTHAPRRRASDREELDLPTVSGDGTGTRQPESDAFERRVQLAQEQAQALESESKQQNAEGNMSELPDMSDLAGFDDDEMLQRLEVG